MSIHENPWETLASREVYANPWIRVREDQVVRPDGQPGLYGVVEFKNWAIGIVPVSGDGDTYLVGQYRYTLKDYSWEIPEGGGAIGVPPLETAQRELLEETGIQAGHWTYLGELHTSNSVTDEVAFLFLAQQLRLGESQPEETERLEVKRMPLAEAVQHALSGEISDALSVAGLLRAWHFLNHHPSMQIITRNFPG